MWLSVWATYGSYMDLVWSIFFYKRSTSVLVKIVTIPLYGLPPASDMDVGRKLSTGLFQYPRFLSTNSNFFGSHKGVSEY